jgi:hypothetical protein
LCVWQALKITKDWDSSDEKITKVSDSSDIKKRTAVDRIREKVAKYVEKQKQEHAYRKTPEYLSKKIDKMNQEAQLLKAQEKIAKSKSRIAQARAARIKTNLGSFGSFGTGLETSARRVGKKMKPTQQSSYSAFDSMFGGVNDSIHAQPMDWSGMDSMLGHGGGSSYTKKSRSGFDDLFGI